MLTAHYLLMFLKVYLVLHTVFRVPKISKISELGWINILNLVVLMIVDLVRYYQYSRLVMIPSDANFLTPMILLGTFYLVKKLKRIPILLCIYTAINLISMLSAAVISSFFLSGIPTMFTDAWYSLLGNSVGMLVLMMICLIMKRNKVYFELNDIGLLRSIFLFFGLFIYGSHLATFWLLNSHRDVTLMVRLIDIISFIVGYVSIFSVLIAINKNKQLKIKELKEQYLEELLVQKRQYEEAERKQIKAIRKLGHDMNEHLISTAILDRTGQSLRVSTYIEELLGVSLDTILISEEKTGSNLVSANLNYLKREKYSHLDIDFEWEGEVPENVKLSDRDLTDLFVNLLKNAFEAVSKIQGKKYIKVEVKSDDTFYINVRNNHTGNFKKEGERFLTTKPDEENHGFGLSIIKEVSSKYNGDLRINVTDIEFEIEILFRNEIYLKD